MLTLLDIDLTLFDGGAAGAPAAGPAGESGTTPLTENRGGGDGGAQAGVKMLPGSSRRAKQAGGPAVVYGKIATEGGEGPDAGGEQAPKGDGEGEKRPPEPKDRKNEFERLIREEYKDEFTGRVQEVIDRRFKETKQLEARVKAHAPVLDLLFTRYGIGDGDVAKLQKAIDEDTAYWSEAAEAAGMSVEQFRKYQKLQAENESFRRERENAEQQRQANAQVERWVREAEGVTAVYKDFDLRAEMASPQFVSLLKSGVPMEHAYKVMHFDDIVSGVAKHTARQTEKTVVDGIRAKGVRPAENGVAAAGGVVVKSDVSTLSRMDRAEVARRVARGEKISF